jgi:hypothetical protein
MPINNRQKLLTILVVVVVVLFAADKVIIPPAKKFYQTRRTEIATLKKNVAQGKQLLQREQTIRRRWGQMITNTLPYDRPLAEQRVLFAVDTWSQDSRVSIMSILPQWKQESDDYMTLHCRVDSAGDLGSLTRFLYAIESDPLAMKIESFEITSKDKDGRQLSLGLQISGLVMVPTESKK